LDNYSAILANALKLFAARGYDAVGVQEIAESAGITKPTLYHYFGSKEGLLEALLTANFAELYNTTEEATLYKGDLPQTLNQITTSYFRFANEHRLFYRMLLSMWFAPTDSIAYKAVAQLNEKQQQRLEDVFIKAAHDHGNMKGRQRAYAATFLGMIHTYIGLALNGYTEFTDELIFKAVHQFMHGIFS
jgi:AcrR family transcriptional regulator